MTAYFSVKVDWNRNGVFTDAGEDITEDVMSVNWRLGMRQAFQTMADESQADIILDNSAGKYSPENTGSTLYPNVKPSRLVRIYDASGNSMWLGKIETIEADVRPAGAVSGTTQARIRCIGLKSYLDRAQVDLALYQNTTGDVVVEDILAQASIPPAVGGLWLLGVVGSSEIGETTTLGSELDYSVVDTGLTTFTTFLDQNTGNGYAAIQQVTEGERGRFYFDRDGKATWRNRHWLLAISSDSGTISYTGTYKPQDVDYVYGAYFQNEVRVTVNPRSSSGTTTLYSLPQPVSVRGGESQSFDAYLRDGDGQFVGSAAVSVGTATFSAGTATVSVESLGNRGRVTVDNTANTATATLSALTLSGNGLQSRNPITVVSSDAASIEEYGLRTLNMTIPALEMESDARSIADFELQRRYTPRGAVTQASFVNRADGTANAHHLAWTFGTRLNVVLPNGHDADYFVIGEEHAWRLGNVHETRFHLEPAQVNDFWALGVSTLGDNTYLAY